MPNNKEEVVRVRWVITKQLNFGSQYGFLSNCTYTHGQVPGIVLDKIKQEILLHFPSLIDCTDGSSRHVDKGKEAQLNTLVENICKRLAQPEEFDFDKSLDSNHRWKRGIFTEK
jgi:hypothetical protein